MTTVEGFRAAAFVGLGFACGLGVASVCYLANLRALIAKVVRLRSALRIAFMEGRESTTGTDRHRADDAWRNSRAKRIVEGS